MGLDVACCWCLNLEHSLIWEINTERERDCNKILQFCICDLGGGNKQWERCDYLSAIGWLSRQALQRKREKVDVAVNAVT